MKKFLFFDTETTGTDPDKNGIIQFGGLIYAGILSPENKPLEKFNIKSNAIGHGCEVAKWQDFKTKEWMTPSDIHGITDDEVKTYPAHTESYKEVISIFDKHVDKFNKEDKLIPVGYNIQFDCDMLRGWARQCGDKYINSYLNHSYIDVMSIARAADALGVLPETPKNHKLETMCELLGIEIKAHDAVSDITATKDLFFALIELIEGNKENSDYRKQVVRKLNSTIGEHYLSSSQIDEDTVSLTLSVPGKEDTVYTASTLIGAYSELHRDETLV